MDTLKVHSQTITLVDQVEDKLLNYLKEKDIRTLQTESRYSKHFRK